jgi:hypothetical protein
MDFGSWSRSGCRPVEQVKRPDAPRLPAVNSWIMRYRAEPEPSPTRGRPRDRMQLYIDESRAHICQSTDGRSTNMAWHNSIHREHGRHPELAAPSSHSHLSCINGNSSAASSFCSDEYEDAKDVPQLVSASQLQRALSPSIWERYNDAHMPISETPTRSPTPEKGEDNWSQPQFGCIEQRKKQWARRTPTQMVSTMSEQRNHTQRNRSDPRRETSKSGWTEPELPIKSIEHACVADQQTVSACRLRCACADGNALHAQFCILLHV